MPKPQEEVKTLTVPELVKSFEENRLWAESMQIKLLALGKSLSTANYLMSKGGEKMHRLAAFVSAIDGCIGFIRSIEDFREHKLDAALADLQLNLKDVALNGITPDDFEGRKAQGSTERAKLLKLLCAVGMQIYIECGLSPDDAAQRVYIKMRRNKGVSAARVKEWRDEFSRRKKTDLSYADSYHRMTTHLRLSGEGKISENGMDRVLEEQATWHRDTKLKTVRSG